MADPIKAAGDEARNQYLNKALHANDEAASKATVSDLFNKDSAIYQKPEPTEEELAAIEAEKQKNAPKPKPTVDEEGYPIIDNVRTYKEDLANIVNKDKISLEHIAMMQAAVNEKMPQEVKKPADKRSLAFIISGISLLVIGVVIIFAVFAFRKKAELPTPVTQQKERYIIVSESKQDLNISNSTKTEIENSIKKYGGNFKEQDSVKEFVIKNGDTVQGTRVTLQELLAKVNSRTPDDLTRSLYPQFFLGLYSKNGNTNPFLLFFVKSYDIAYPGMLKWEGFMRDDLNWIFDTKPKIGTTTPELTFKDKVISNSDARSFEDPSGKVTFFYVFLDQNTILLARTPDTVRMVQDRLRQAKFQ